MVGSQQSEQPIIDATALRYRGRKIIKLYFFIALIPSVLLSCFMFFFATKFVYIRHVTMTIISYSISQTIVIGSIGYYLFVLTPRVDSWYCTYKPTRGQKIFTTVIVSLAGFLVYLPTIMFFVRTYKYSFDRPPWSLFVLPISVMLCLIIGSFIASIPDIEPKLNPRHYYVWSINLGIIATTTLNGVLFIGLSKFVFLILLVMFIHIALLTEASLLKRRIIDETWMTFIARLYGEKRCVDHNAIVTFCGRELFWGDICDLAQYFTSQHSIFSLKLDVEIDIEVVIRGVRRRIKQIDDKVFVELCEKGCVPDNFRVINFTIRIPQTYRRTSVHILEKKKVDSKRHKKQVVDIAVLFIILLFLAHIGDSIYMLQKYVPLGNSPLPPSISVSYYNIATNGAYRANWTINIADDDNLSDLKLAVFLCQSKNGSGTIIPDPEIKGYGLEYVLSITKFGSIDNITTEWNNGTLRISAYMRDHNELDIYVEASINTDKSDSELQRLYILLAFWDADNTISWAALGFEDTSSVPKHAQIFRPCGNLMYGHPGFSGLFGRWVPYVSNKSGCWYSDTFSYACLGFMGYSRDGVLFRFGKSYNISYRLVGYVGFVWYVTHGDIYYVFKRIRDHLSPVCILAKNSSFTFKVDLWPGEIQFDILLLVFSVAFTGYIIYRLIHAKDEEKRKGLEIISIYLGA